MSKVKTGYMAELDAWSDKSIIEPLADAYLRGPEEVIINAQEYALKAIREKVLDRTAMVRPLVHGKCSSVARP